MKKRSCKLFDAGLYLESLRQLRLMGLTYLLLCLVFTALPPILSGASLYSTPGYGQAAALYVFDFVAPVTMAFLSFGYLMRRNASDFYHSLPITREAAFFSRTLAILTYAAGTIVLSLVLSFALFDIAGAVNWLQLPCLLSYHLLCFLLVLACTLIGLSLTGTWFAALTVTGLVLFLPRMILVVIAGMAVSSGHVLFPEEMGLLLNVNYNLPVSLIAALFTGDTVYGTDPFGYMFYLPSHLYTLGLSVLYLIVGCALHHGRKSELARTAAPNRVMQHVTRCLISLPLFLLLGACAAVCDWEVDSDTLTVLAVCAVLVYFLYELITTRRLRNLLPALAVLPIVAALGLGVPWIGTFIGQRELSRCPDVQQVESVSFDPTSDFDVDCDYTTWRLSQVEHDDPELIELMHGALTRTIDYYAASGAADTAYPSGYRLMQVRFNLKDGGTLTRKVRVTPDQQNRLAELRARDPEFQGALRALPTAQQLTGLTLTGVELWDSDQAQMKALWDTFREEYAALSPDEKLELNTYTYSNSWVESSTVELEPAREDALFYTELGQEVYEPGCFLNYYCTEGVRSFYGCFKVTAQTPETLLQAMQLINSADVPELLKEDILTLRQELAGEASQGELYLYGTLQLYDPSGEYSGSVDLSHGIRGEYAYADVKYDDGYYVPQDFLTCYDELLSILLRGDAGIVDLDSPIVYVDSLGFENFDQGKGYHLGSAFLRLTEEDFARLLAIVQTPAAN